MIISVKFIKGCALRMGIRKTGNMTDINTCVRAFLHYSREYFHIYPPLKVLFFHFPDKFVGYAAQHIFRADFPDHAVDVCGIDVGMGMDDGNEFL